jgi:hypothetical protein
MIRVFRPPWNGMGMGSKVVGGRRMGQEPSLWDSLHPGRVGRPKGSESQQQKAVAKLDQCVEDLRRPIQEPVVREMHKKIMRYFQAEQLSSE